MQAEVLSSDIGHFDMGQCQAGYHRHGDGMVIESQLSPLCPNCGKPLRFTRLIPAIGALTELYSYYCDTCVNRLRRLGAG